MHTHLREQSTGGSVRRLIHTSEHSGDRHQNSHWTGIQRLCQPGQWRRQVVWGGLGDGAICKPGCIRTTEEAFSTAFFLGPQLICGWLDIGVCFLKSSQGFWCSARPYMRNVSWRMQPGWGAGWLMPVYGACLSSWNRGPGSLVSFSHHHSGGEALERSESWNWNLQLEPRKVVYEAENMLGDNRQY